MKYYILHHSNIIDLENLVTIYIKNGWKPLGGVAYNPNSSSFLQAMIYEA